MKSNYKFYDLIEEVKEYNTELQYGLNDIVGVTIEKGLIPTVANLQQTSLEKFYIVKPKTFIYNPRTHGVRLGMGYNNTEKIYITTWNNVAFKVKKSAESILNPDYLWIYFNRSEWDRETNYHAWGSSTIVFSWNVFLGLQIDIPPKNVQDKICKAYKTITDRIALKQRINENLTEQLHKYLLNFIEQDSTKKIGKLKDYSTMQYGYTETALSEDTGTNFLRITDIAQSHIDWNSVPFCKISDSDLKKYHLSNGDVVVARTGATVGVAKMIGNNIPNSVFASFLVRIRPIDDIYKYYFGLLITSKIFLEYVRNNAGGSAQPQANPPLLGEFELIIPDKSRMSIFNDNVSVFLKSIEVNEFEIIKLNDISKTLITMISSC